MKKLIASTFLFTALLASTATSSEQNTIKQADKLCQAIIANDYNKTKALLDGNPRLINLANTQGKRVLFVFAQHNKQIQMYDLLLEYKPELNLKVDKCAAFIETFLFDCDLSDANSVKLIDKSIKAGASIAYLNSLCNENTILYTLSYAYVLGKYELFSYLLGHDEIKIDGFMLQFISMAMEYIHGTMKYEYLQKALDEKYQKRASDDNYNDLRKHFFSYLDEVLKRRGFDFLNQKELDLLIRVFCYIDDEKAIKYLLNKGFCGVDKYCKMIKQWANFYKSEKISKLIKGANND